MIKINKIKARHVMWFYVFMLPALVGFTLLSVYPFFRALYISFTDRTLLGFEQTNWIGIDNYARAFKDPYMWESLRISLVYALCTLLITNITGMLTALLLTAKHRFIKVFRTIYYLPSIIPSVASVIMYGFIFNPSGGVVNSVLLSLGVENPPMWLTHTKTALLTMILLSFWSFGGKMVIYLAGLVGIPVDYYEAADLEGANNWQCYWHITFPQMTPVIFYNVMMSIVGGLQVFTEAYVMSGTGMGVPIRFFVVNLYSHAYSGEFDLGYASALAWILFFVIGIITVLYNYINKKFFSYD